MAEFGWITICEVNTFNYPVEVCNFGQITVAYGRAFLKQLTLSKALSFMPAATLTAIEITHPQEVSALPLVAPSPVTINRDYGYDPAEARVSYNASFSGTDLITGGSFAVLNNHQNEAPTVAFL